MGLSSERKAYLDELCNKFRIDVIKTLHSIQTGHRVARYQYEILVTLYFEKATIDPKNPKWEDRDRIIALKRPCGSNVIQNIGRKGFLSVEEMMPEAVEFSSTKVISALTPRCRIICRPVRSRSFSSIRNGVKGLNCQGKNSYVYVILGDGELNKYPFGKGYVSKQI